MGSRRLQIGVLAASVALLFLATVASAQPLLPMEEVRALLGEEEGPIPDTGVPEIDELRESVAEWMGDDGSGGAAPPGAGGEAGLGERLRDAFRGEALLIGLAGILVTALGIGGFAFVTRYVSPKEALKNPQRAMLFGFIKATPGAHLKQLSEEFKMKTSSILWHIRKLESADLVRSERANGFRVFYPVAGGVEIKRLSRAITALQNENARGIHELVERRPGVTVKEVSERLSVHNGTVRWHLRKLREFGLLEELVRDDGSLFYVTPLGRKALEAVVGAPVPPVTKRPAITANPAR